MSADSVEALLRREFAGFADVDRLIAAAKKAASTGGIDLETLLCMALVSGPANLIDYLRRNGGTKFGEA